MGEITAGIGLHGTLLRRGSGASPEVYTVVSEVKDINGPGFTLTMHGATHQQSDYSEKLPGMRNVGQVTFTLQWKPDNTNHNLSQGILSDWNNKTKRSFQVLFPTTPQTHWTFFAYVSNFAVKSPVDGILTADLTLELSGGVTQT